MHPSQVTLARPSAQAALRILGVCTLVALVWSLSTGAPDHGPRAFWPGLGAVFLELWVVPLPGFGHFPLAAPYYLALVLGPGPGVALVLAYGVGLARAALGRGTLTEALVQGAPVLAAVAVARLPLSPLWVLWLACAQVWLLAAWLLPRQTAAAQLRDDEVALWERVQERTVLGLTALAALGLGLAAWPGNGPTLLLAVPVLLALRQSMRAALSRREAEFLQRRLTVTNRELDLARAAETSTRRELTMLEELTRALARNPEPGEVMDRILVIAMDLCCCESAVLFGPLDASLVPVRARGPHARRLRDARLLNLSEPTVEAAWRTGQPQRAERRAEEPRLMANEHAAALPLGPLGVLYLGDSRSPIDAELLPSLRMLAAYAELSLRCAQAFQGQQTSLEQYARANESLLQWGAALARALEGVAGLVSTLDPRVVEERLRQGAAAVLPPHRLEVLWPGQQHELARSVVESGRPLLFEELAGTRFQRDDARSLLAVPLVGPEGPAAVLVASSPQPGQFTRQHQDLLGVLAYQAGAAYHSAEAYRRLQDSEAQLVSSARTAAVGQLAAGVAHELNTPLGSIIVALEAAGQNLEKRPERSRRMLDRALSSAQKAESIVARLLFYSREGGAAGEEFDLNEVVQDTLTFVSQQLEGEGVALRTSLHPEPLPTLGGARSVQQILLNLLFNARDAVLEPAASGREVMVSTHRGPGQVALTVRDQGPGVPPELWDRIFEPFYTTRPVGHGAGLGLYTSRQLAEKAGGSLKVSSPPATFTLVLPLAGEEPQGV